jgi:cysteine-rich repeat protein
VCKLATCGDGFKQPGEACDLGVNNSNTGACTLACKLPLCGDLFVQPSNMEECDDGNQSNADVCLTTCKAAKCGDGFIQVGVEQCDDGNQASNDGCSATCTGEALGRIFLTSSNGTAGFYGYNIANNTWTPLANPPAVTFSQITNDGTVVYLLGSNNVVYQYNIFANSWSVALNTGPGQASNPIGYFKWTNQGFFYANDGDQVMQVYKNNAWSPVNLTRPASCAGSWDRANNELYIRTYQQLGFQVFNTTNNALVRTITDAINITENSRTGSLSGGFFYTREYSGPLLKYDRINGAKTNTAQNLTSGHTGSDTDLTTGFIYFAGYDNSTVFQRYNPANNTVTTLAASPSVSNHSTITVMIPP